ncbi:MAG: hypothetical protein BroJett011_78530 [Chloroflexota bacterium]|nr:MAG: hypothetical protein BroJett011_78530 [Chloroflexota bacterium]
MDTKAIVTLQNGSKVSGRLTTAHPASSYGQAVFVDDDGNAYNWIDIVDVKTTEGQSKGGKAGTQAQNAARAANAKKGGYPKGKPRKPKTQPTKRGADGENVA